MERRSHLPAMIMGLALFASPSLGHAQTDRYDLGLRMRAFERIWETESDPVLRKQIITPLKEAMSAFFSLRMDKAAEGLDRARLILERTNPANESIRWANSLLIQPGSRLIDARDAALPIVIKSFYPKPIDAPADARIRITVGGSRPVEVPITMLPQVIRLDCTKVPGPSTADMTLKTELVTGKVVLATREQTLSRVENLAGRLAGLQHAVAQLPKPRTRIEESTLKQQSETLTLLADRATFETDYPAARLIVEAESIIAGLPDKRAYYGPDRPGEFWLTLPTSDGPGVCRMFVPPGLRADQPVPMVVALHGAGGSENMFFDGYGDGQIVKLCKTRGWLLIAPRGPALIGTAPVGPMLDVLMERFPIDRKRVFLVGHSMGAAQAVAFTQMMPTRFAMVAALGGGGSVRKTATIQQVPFFIGVGTDDFALSGSRALRKSLEAAGVTKVEYQEYADVEHITIVRHALPDVFKRFDAIGLKGR